jgi:Rrf2 family transcriptional regulator, iron-sulfur cluster assembly transcription factor
MKVSALEEYGLRCLVQLAREGAELDGATTLSARQIAEREGLSLEYATQILAELRRAGFVSSSRGVHGGFRLARPARDITVGELFRSFGGPIADDICEQYTGTRTVCAHANGCSVAPIWAELARRIYGFLDGVSVADIASASREAVAQVVPLTALRRR